LSREAFVIRYFLENHDDRLLLVNLGVDLNYSPCPEPLLAPVEGRGWRVAWNSEAPEYGGCGSGPVEVQGGFRIPGRAAVVFVTSEDDPLKKESIANDH
jgi:maltooligosyltrehalose trehalohydrolase